MQQEIRVTALSAEVDAEIEHLAALYDEADAAVGNAVRRPTPPMPPIEEALSAVDAAQAREEERRRQEEEHRATTTPPPEEEVERRLPRRRLRRRRKPPTVVEMGAVEGGWDFPPSVEQWRSLVQAYFPSSRVEEALAILQCESLGDADAYNPYSGASGLFNSPLITWAHLPQAGFSGASVFDGGANIGTRHGWPTAIRS